MPSDENSGDADRVRGLITDARSSPASVAHDLLEDARMEAEQIDDEATRQELLDKIDAELEVL